MVASRYPVVKVVGVGGGGLHAAEAAVKAAVPGVEIIAVDADSAALEKSGASEKIQLSSDAAGVTPWAAHEAALTARNGIENALRGADVVIVAAGLGGKTGSGASPVVAAIARSAGCVVVAVLTLPFAFEGSRRVKQADHAHAAMAAESDKTVVIRNQDLLVASTAGEPLSSAFTRADDALVSVVRAAALSFVGDHPKHDLVDVRFDDVRMKIAARAEL